MTRLAAVEVGGSHVCAAWMDTGRWAADGEPYRAPLNASGPAAEIIQTIAGCADRLGDLTNRSLSVAMPGPFDYVTGVGRFRDVGKFDALDGVAVGARVHDSLNGKPSGIVFVNDAAAFGLGEWIAGAAAGHRRAVALTLGTGIGSAFIADGTAVSEGAQVPPCGFVHLLRPGGAPLEDRVSTRAIVQAYGGRAEGVIDVIRAARDGDDRAIHVLDDAFGFLGSVLAPWVRAFAAEVIVVGGKIADAWDEVEPRLSRGLASRGARIAIRPAAHADTAALVGAAYNTVAQAGADSGC